jgi:hypothetical protein
VAKSKRDFLKRSAAQAVKNIDNAIIDLADLYNVFAGVHDDYAEYLKLISECLLIQQSEIKKFCVLAWNMDTTKLDSYL